MIGTAHRLSPEFDRLLQAALGPSLETSSATALKIKQLSDFYLEHPGLHTPWDKPYAADAYLSYFLPLNLVRLQAAFQEVKRFIPSYSEIWDFGSGVGTTQWMLEGQTDVAPLPFFAIERAPEALALYRRLLALEPTRWKPNFSHPAKPSAGALGIFSYSFLEMQSGLPDLEGFEHLLIVEPSTRECGRDLMQWRAKLMTMGFQPLAPCTHSQACPLLVNSTKDWCHMRVHFSAPEWWRDLEAHLPMKNRTLTYSYLLMSRSAQDTVWRGAARAIGDTLQENGKTRQMICRGPQREFLSWLHRNGPAPQIPHGALVRGVERAEVKGGGEIRPASVEISWVE